MKFNLTPWKDVTEKEGKKIENAIDKVWNW